MTLTFTAALRASQGGRRYQEDTGLLWPGPSTGAVDTSELAGLPDGHLLALIADGMGGHVAGAVASQLACTSFLQGFLRRFNNTGTGLMDRLIHTLEGANGVLTERIQADPNLDGMGTTLIAAYVLPHELGSGLTWISVGDSLLYLWRRGELARLNEDHSLAPVLDKLVEDGRLDAREAEVDPRRHYLRSAVTGGDIEMIDVTPRPLPLAEGDVLVVATDGLHSLDEVDIERHINETVGAGADAIASRLIGAIDALRLPHQDNTTVAVVRIGADAP